MLDLGNTIERATRRITGVPTQEKESAKQERSLAEVSYEGATIEEVEPISSSSSSSDDEENYYTPKRFNSPYAAEAVNFQAAATIADD